MVEPKVDFPPLMAGGLHPMDLAALRELTVARFPESQRRPLLFATLEIYLQLLGATGIRAVVWVDGSFMCEKPEPDDIDMVVLFERRSVLDAELSAQQQMDALLNTKMTKTRFKLHVFAVRDDNEAIKRYWKDQFGTQRDEITPKGLAELRVNK